MFQGSLPALVTPFRDGAVDLAALEALVDWQIAEGSTGLVPVGTTGESPTLSHEEHDRVVAAVVRRAAGRVPVIAGAGSNNTSETVRLVEARKAVGRRRRPRRHALLQQAHPGRAGRAFRRRGRGGPAHRHLQHPRPLGGGHDARHDGRARAPPHDRRRQGRHGRPRPRGQDAPRLRPRLCPAFGRGRHRGGFNAMGGRGCISVTANVAPRLCARMQAATLAGDYAQALELQDLLQPLHEAIFLEPGLAGAKWGLSLLGRCGPEVRSPLLPPTEADPGRDPRRDGAGGGAGLGGRRPFRTARARPR
jgi:4-hydroxy-tetrahydrodipicolinate synthase